MGVGRKIVNSGALIADNGILEFVGMVSGGSILIGDGTVDIQQASADNVTFQFGGTGGLELPVASAYTGKVSGFGGNSDQFIDFININSSGATVTYTSSTSSSGVLKVTSGGHTLASIHMVGHYTTADFPPGNDGSGHLEITDPPVVEQKSGNAPATIADGTVLEVKVPIRAKSPSQGQPARCGSTTPRPSPARWRTSARKRASICRASPSASTRRSGTRRTAATPAVPCPSRREPTSRSLRSSATTWPRALSPRPTAMAARSSRRRPERHQQPLLRPSARVIIGSGETSKQFEERKSNGAASRSFRPSRCFTAHDFGSNSKA